MRGQASHWQFNEGVYCISLKCPETGNASHYYRLTRLLTAGEFTIRDMRFQVSGTSWRDHASNASALTAGQVVWDWFSLQLDNGSDLIVFQIRRKDGSVDPFSSGTLVDPDRIARHLAWGDIGILVQDARIGPRTGAEYPVGWMLKIPKYVYNLYMSQALLATKLYAPPVRREMVSRTRLVERLEDGLQGKLTLVSAPAGFGKSTLLSECAVHCNRPMAWVSLDPGDNNPARFLAYVLAAIRKISEGVGENLMAELLSSEPPAVDGLLTGLVNEIAIIDHPFVLTLDDYHVITDGDIHRAVAFILENQPPHMHLIIVGRADPPWPLARLRARGEMTELRAKDLRFTLEEATIFLNDVMGFGLSPQDIAALETRTEGWIAGLHMAALSMLGRKDVTGFIRSFSASHRFILDYLVEEVLDQQSPAIQEFLLRTSVLDRMTAPLCDAVLEGSPVLASSSDLTVENRTPSPPFYSSQELLEHLEEVNLFVTPLDDERCWYRYHHLFADLLRNRMREAYPDQVEDLHLQASQWYERGNYIEEAIGHAIAGQDFERAAWLVEQHALQFIIESKLVTLSGWFESLPAEVERRRPWLCVYHAWTRYWIGMHDQVAECLEYARGALETISETIKTDAAARGFSVTLSNDERKRVLGCIAAVGVYENLTNLDIDGAIASAQEAMELLPDMHYMHSIAALGLGESYSMLGDHQAAIQAFRKASSISQRHGYRSLSVSTTCFMGIEQARLGDLKRADDTFQEAMSLAIESGGRQLLAAGFPLVELGDMLREWNDLTSASLKIEQGVELCSRWGHPGFLMKGYLALIRLKFAQQDWDGMADVLEKANQKAGKAGLDPEMTGYLDDWQIRYWMGIGDVDAAVHWLEISQAKQTGELKFYQHFIELLTQVWVLVHFGIRLTNNVYLAQAPDLLDRLQLQIGQYRWLVERIKIQILRAVVYKARGDRKRAQKAFSTALNLGEPGGYMRTFLDEGEPIRELLHHAAAGETASEYAKRLYLAYEQDETRYPAQEARTIGDSALPLPGRLVEPLSQRELEVLRLLASNLNSTEIATELYISVSTVRTHIKNIYSKLNVHRRFEAVQKGRDLGLL